MSAARRPDFTSPPLADAPAASDAPPRETPAATPPDRADAPVSEVTERFLRAIVQRLPLARIEELHLFSPLRQGSVETGIAVVAAEPAPPPAPPVPPTPAVAASQEGEAPVEGSATAEGSADAVEPAAGEPDGGAAESPAAPPVKRHEVYTARYRLVLKGPERGKWEEDLVVEADAPLVTVETVVRGVQRRAGEATETVRYGAAQVARALRLPYPAP